MNEIEKLKEHENLFLINNDLWWSKEDIQAYDYLKVRMDAEMKLINSFLNKKRVVVQAGGHCGFIPKLLKNDFETVYTFEPNASMFLALCLNVPDNNVFKFQACVGNEHKLVGLSNWVENSSGSGFINKTGNVPILKIDDLNLNICDFLMLDTEGYEYYALLGARQTIEKFKPLLCLERCWGLRTTGLDEAIIDNLLDSWGYKEVARSWESDRLYQVK
jgi:FkbM family methyltransferase